MFKFFIVFGSSKKLSGDKDSYEIYIKNTFKPKLPLI